MRLKVKKFRFAVVFQETGNWNISHSKLPTLQPSRMYVNKMANANDIQTFLHCKYFLKKLNNVILKAVTKNKV